MDTAVSISLPAVFRSNRHAERGTLFRPVPLLHFIHPQLHSMAQTAWWMRVEAMLLVDGNVHLAAFRREHKPTLGEYLEGKLNGLQFSQCVDVDDATRPAMTLLYEAAERRIPLFGLIIFVSTLPPSPETERLAQSGIATLLYATGTPSSCDREAAAAAGVKLVHVV